MQDTNIIVQHNKLKLHLAQAENALRFYVHALKEYEHMKRKMEAHIDDLKHELGSLPLEEEADPIHLNSNGNERNEKQKTKV